MHYYSFNIGDYAVDTRHLSLMEDLAYRRLLDLYYSSEKPINSDTKKVSRLIGMVDYPQEIAQVLEDFFILSECGYVQSRANDEISKFHAKADSARINGKKGGRPKKAKANPAESEAEPKITQSVNLANPEESGSKANYKPLTNNQELITNNQEPKTINKVKRFVKPTPQELVEWFIEKGSNQDQAERFFNHYESNGWKVGKNPMKSWKAAVANWLKNNFSNQSTQQRVDPDNLSPLGGNY